MRFGKYVLISLLMLCMAGCNAQPHTLEHGAVNIGAWIPYWDTSKSMKELKEAKYIKSVSVFSVSFDEDDNLYFLDMSDDGTVVSSVQDNVKALRRQGVESVYLCAVNDIKPRNNGSDKMKDIEVLKRVFEDDDIMEEHADSLIELAKEAEVDGIDLDYEGVWKSKDDKLINSFLQFTYKLQRKAVQENLKLRITLEPSVNFAAAFCKGPEYVVMLYNLYGTHSEAGPKADYDFIKKVIKKMDNLPTDNKAVAFSTGGCLWSEKGKTRFITEERAVELMEKHSVKPERDNNSGALHYKYKDKKNGNSEVWYADNDTITSWIAEAEANGISNIYLWRLGSNTTIRNVR